MKPNFEQILQEMMERSATLPKEFTAAAEAMGLGAGPMLKTFLPEEVEATLSALQPPPPSNKREAQKEKRRGEILNAGLDLFIRRGYAATKISDIADAAGMSTGLLFHYFDSKEKLYEELVRLGQYGPNSIMQIDKSDPLAFFEMSANLILGMLRMSPTVAKIFVLMGQAQHNEAAPEAVREMVSRIESIPGSVAVIEEGQRLGGIREGEPLALSITFWSAVQGVAEYFALSTQPPQVEADWLVDILRAK